MMRQAYLTAGLEQPGVTFTISPRVREFLRTGISGYCLVLPANEPVPDGLNYGLGLITRVIHYDRLLDGTFWLVPERAFEMGRNQ